MSCLERLPCSHVDCSKNKEGCAELLSPYTVILTQQAESGSTYQFKTVPYAVFFEAVLAPVLNAFDACVTQLQAVASTDAHQAEIAYLQQYRSALSETNGAKLEEAWEACDRKWMACKGSIQVVHDIEVAYLASQFHS